MSLDESAVLHRSLRFIPQKIVGGKGSYVELENGQKFLDSTGGAAVACIGHGNEEVKAAVMKQMDEVSYCHSVFFGTSVFEELASLLVESTGGEMTKVFIVSSGISAYFSPFIALMFWSIHDIFICPFQSFFPS